MGQGWLAFWRVCQKPRDKDVLSAIRRTLRISEEVGTSAFASKGYKGTGHRQKQAFQAYIDKKRNVTFSMKASLDISLNMISTEVHANVHAIQLRFYLKGN